MHILSDVVSFVGGKCYKATQLFPHESSFAFSEAVLSNVESLFCGHAGRGHAGCGHAGCGHAGHRFQQ